VIYRLFLAILLTLSPPLHSASLIYIYINASEGTASGGHSALKFGKYIFHFQHFPGNIIRLVKQDSADFEYQYRYLDNRSLFQATIKLDKSSYNSLYDYFNQQHLIQQQQNKLLKEIELNLALFNKLQHTSYAHDLLRIKGAGLFSEQESPPDAISSQVNQHIKTHIINKLGTQFLDKKQQQLLDEIQSLQPKIWPNSTRQFTENDFISIPNSFARQYINNVSKRLFIKSFKNNVSLNTQLLFTSTHSSFILQPAEIQSLRNFQNQLITKLCNLLNSNQPNWGSAAFILYARIISIAHSIHTGKLYFLDTYLSSSPSISNTELNRYKKSFFQQKEQALAYIIQHKNLLLSTKHSMTELQYSQFVMLVNYFYERERALNSSYLLRSSGEQRLPSKAIPLPTIIDYQLNLQEIQFAIKRLKHDQQQIKQQIKSLYHYDLIQRNCVTEIYKSLQSTQINYLPELRYLKENYFINFIPSRAFAKIAEYYPKNSLASYRQMQLQEMYHHENNILVYLRESNTISALNYQFNEIDSPFLFFTDDMILPRPLFGMINFITAGAMTLYGGLRFPFDSGKTFQKSIMGMLMSLPELFFFNIRKGSYKHVPLPKINNSHIMHLQPLSDL